MSTFGIGAAGQTVVDLGTGTGTLARGFARRGCKVIGIDPDAHLLNQAWQLDATFSAAVDYTSGRAEAVPLGDASADIVAAGQCWHWFDGPRAATEVRRILRPVGRVVVAYFPGSHTRETSWVIGTFPRYPRNTTWRSAPPPANSRSAAEVI